MFWLGGGLAQAGTFLFTTIDDPSAQFYPATYANALNNSGVITGSYSTSEFHSTGFIYNGGAFSTISDTKFQIGSSVNDTNPTGINDSGVIVGSYRNLFGTNGFVYSNGTFTDIDVAGAFDTYATGINNSGQIVGYSYNGTSYSGFLDSSGSFASLNDPHAGNSFGQGTYPFSINASGAVVGYYVDSNNVAHGFLEQNGVFTTLDDPNASQVAQEGTYARGINNLGQIVGYSIASGTGQDLGLDYHGFLFSSGSFTTIDNPGAIATGATEVTGINDLGQIVGQFTCATCGDNYQGFFATPNGQSAAPEPSTCPLFIIGTIMVSFFHRGHGCKRPPGRARSGGH